MKFIFWGFRSELFNTATKVLKSGTLHTCDSPPKNKFNKSYVISSRFFSGLVVSAHSLTGNTSVCLVALLLLHAVVLCVGVKANVQAIWAAVLFVFVFSLVVRIGFLYRGTRFSHRGTRFSHRGTRFPHRGTRFSHRGTRFSHQGTRFSHQGTRFSHFLFFSQ